MRSFTRSFTYSFAEASHTLSRALSPALSRTLSRRLMRVLLCYISHVFARYSRSFTWDYTNSSTRVCTCSFSLVWVLVRASLCIICVFHTRLRKLFHPKIFKDCILQRICVSFECYHVTLHEFVSLLFFAHCCARDCALFSRFLSLALSYEITRVLSRFFWYGLGRCIAPGSSDIFL